MAVVRRRPTRGSALPLKLAKARTRQERIACVSSRLTHSLARCPVSLVFGRRRSPRKEKPSDKSPRVGFVSPARRRSRWSPSTTPHSMVVNSMWRRLQSLLRSPPMRLPMRNATLSRNDSGAALRALKKWRLARRLHLRRVQRRPIPGDVGPTFARLFSLRQAFSLTDRGTHHEPRQNEPAESQNFFEGKWVGPGSRRRCPYIRPDGRGTRC